GIGFASFRRPAAAGRRGDAGQRLRHAIHGLPWWTAERDRPRCPQGRDAPERSGVALGLQWLVQPGRPLRNGRGGMVPQDGRRIVGGTTRGALRELQVERGQGDDRIGRADSWVKDSLVDGGALRVARIEPRTTRTEPIAMPTVRGSLSSATPSASATAGLTYVMTVARAEPATAMSAKKSTKASAVQTIPSTATANTTAGEGRVGGSCAIPTGPYTSAVIARDAATTPGDGRVES